MNAANLSNDHRELLKTFLAEETARGRRPKGIVILSRLIPVFISFMEERGKRVVETSLADASEYQGELSSRCTKTGSVYAAVTVASIVNRASIFCDWLVKQGLCMANPFEGVRRIRVPRRVPEGILKEAETEAVLQDLAAWDSETALLTMRRRYTAHVVAELQYASGIRIAEAADLRPEDIDLDRALVHVREGKQGSNRYAFLTDYACDVLDLYRSRVRHLFMNRGNQLHADRLFLVGEHELGKNVSEELAAACRRVGVRAITSHGFRHALGYHLLRAGCPLRYIQAILGHKNIRNSEIYTKVDVDDVKRVFDECHPRMR
jgi:site-specific recombinase XerD